MLTVPLSENATLLWQRKNFDMASLLTDPLFEISGRAPPPSKNFHHLVVTKSQVSTYFFW